MFVFKFLGPSVQSLAPVPEPIREWPAPAKEADVSAKCATQWTSDHDGEWSYLKTIELYRVMSLFGSTKPSTPAPPTKGTSSASLPKTVYYLGVLRIPSDKNARSEQLVGDLNLSMYGFLVRKSYEEPFMFSVKLVAERTPVGQRRTVNEKGLAIYSYHTSLGFCVVMVTKAEDEDEKNYDLAAGSILSKTADGFNSAFPLKTIQTDPANTFAWPKISELRLEAEKAHMSGINAVQRELDETKIVLHQTIEQVLARGEKLDDLVAKSDELGTLSKGFYKQAAKQNSCCIVM